MISSVIPHLVVNDGEAAITFYVKALGAILQSKHAEEKGRRLMHAHVKLGESDLFLHDEFPEYNMPGAQAPTRLGGSSCTIHLEVLDADAAWKQALAAGAEVVVPLDNQFWGARYGQIRDPYGHIWSIGGPVKP